ncbi:TPA: glycosyltransferase family 4 protein [Streptococcus pneumoniae]|uniref:Putative glycosyl transferase n=1 Tax=Streptococcus pneumoniae TaxID=1313 RepID=Q4K192_STREE|nr:glycosyltransferase family 4 protein [Streptococcus pneumoniae]MBW8124606.1 glycosyltransferase family 4 protein [Streptococcus pneumoniae]MDG8164444.1 glycosyltransferase family 4 protein [Streptococcus pneumoniae]MDG8204099.1 glycosyltransferase family 4 protein [Streptococcus pneumoniae]MDG9119262.1 glycosyltransferase family 4 protein [Streptococcus pneumoniae]MDG9272104.1 glycosyltransferase family 4 protein [Streptococcus pneumoniae]
MKILHYTLGFQPQRTGGLVKYAEDLMIEQIAQGYQVAALCPGRIKFFSKKIEIIKATSRQFECYELLNSLPIALFGGISDPTAFMTPCDKNVYRTFLEKVQPDIIHIHSFMGLHKEFLEIAKNLNIRVVFTSHDYYGLAPVPHFYFNGVDYSDKNTNLTWNIMSSNALSVKKLRLFQVSFYPTIRKLLKLLGKNPKSKKNLVIRDVIEEQDYSELRYYYNEMFHLIDGYLFNSRLAKKVYEINEIQPANSVVLSITSSSIKHHQRLTTTNNKIRVSYIGSDEEYKGYFDFIDFAGTLEQESYEVVTYGHLPNEECPSFIEQKGYFTKETIDSVYENIDILIIASKCKETFGLITVEALSYGVNVFVSENVGSKDLLPETHVFKDKEDLLAKIINNQLEKVPLKTMEKHVEEVISYYKQVRSNN